MRIVYAFRRTAFYPDPGREAELPPREVRGPFLRKVEEVGFEGLELAAPHGSEAEIRELRREVGDAGVPCAAVQGGGPSLHPRDFAGNRKRMEAAIGAAAWLGAPVVNASIGMPRPPTARGVLPWGEATCWGSSREATEADFERAAAAFAAAAPLAADHGVAIAVEVHQQYLVDISASPARPLRRRHDRLPEDSRDPPHDRRRGAAGDEADRLPGLHLARRDHR